MSYLALYRKFRPGTFSRLMGQDHVVRALENQLINNRIGHAYLFTGTRGTGKTSAAKIFAKAVNCLNPDGPEPCNECENCRSINAGNFPDVVEVDAASNNGVDDIRRIIEDVRYTPVKGKYKVYIIDEAHMITDSAFNAFLKTLEEPPSYAIFILATTEPHKLPPTILSRVQRYDFKRIPTEIIARNLAYITQSEKAEADEKALRYIARTGDGSMRDSVSLLDKCIAFNLGERLTYENVLDTLGTVDTEVFSALLRRIYSSDVAGALNIVENAVDEGKDLSQFLTDFIWYIRNVLMAGASDTVDMEMLGVSGENMAMIREDSRLIRSDALIRYIRVLSETIDRIRYSSSKQILVEVCLIKLAKPQMETDTLSLAERIRQLEGRTADVPVSMPGANVDTGYSGFQTGQAQAFREAYYSPEDEAPSGMQSASQMEHPDEYAYYSPEDEAPSGMQSMPHMTNPDALEGLMDDAAAVTQPGPGQSPEPYAESQPAGEIRVMPEQAAGQEPDQTAGPQADPAMIRQKILSACDSPIIRSSLNKCSFSLKPEENILEISAPNDFICRQLRDKQTLNILKSIVIKCFGPEMTVHVKVSSSDGQQLTFFSAAAPAQDHGAQDAYTDELLKRINFNIGTEEQ